MTQQIVTKLQILTIHNMYYFCCKTSAYVKSLLAMNGSLCSLNVFSQAHGGGSKLTHSEQVKTVNI